MERMSGEDATFIHLERHGEVCHTLKVVVLDPSERGAPVGLDELRAVLREFLPLYPRARQRVVFAPGFRGLPFWVDDPAFDLDLHVSERVLPAPGGRRELDEVCSWLASSRLDLTRPLWDATLVHGLEGGEQAVVFRVHHAVTDGMGVVRLLDRVTTDRPGPPEPPPVDRWDPSPLPSGSELTKAAIRGLPHTFGLARDLLSDEWHHRRAIAAELKAFRERDDLYTNTLSVPYTWLNPRFGSRRLCATGSLPLAEFRQVKEAAGTTMSNALMAVLAGALRAESEERGRDLDVDLVAGLGMAVEGSGSGRMWGNSLTNLFVSLHTTEPDPLERLRKIDRSFSDTVALKRAATAGRSANAADVGTRLGPTLAKLLAYHVARSAAHLSAGSVPGPATVRWVGGVRISDFYSFAVVVVNAGMNVTSYRYGNSMNVGVLVAPEVHRRPDVFVARMVESMEELGKATAGV